MKKHYQKRNARYVYPSDTFWKTLEWWRNGVISDTHQMKPSKLKVGKKNGEEKLNRRGLLQTLATLAISCKRGFENLAVIHYVDITACKLRLVAWEVVVDVFQVGENLAIHPHNQFEHVFVPLRLRVHARVKKLLRGRTNYSPRSFRVSEGGSHLCFLRTQH